MASAAWERRNELARAKGYASYYDYRAHGYGRQPASAPRSTGEALSQLRGHASRADLQRLVESGRVEILIQEPGMRDPKTGQYRSVRVTAQLSDGSQRTFVLRGRQLERAKLQGLRASVSGAGVDVYTNPSIDVLELSAPLIGEAEEAA